MTVDQGWRFIAPDGSALQVARFGQSGIWLDPTRKTIGELAQVPGLDLIQLVRSCPVIARDEYGSTGGIFCHRGSAD